MIGPPKRLAAALAGVGAVLCVLGWYQASGQPTVAQQIPYLASATIPGAALLAAGAVALLRPSASTRPAAAHATTASGAEEAFLRVPDGRYVHVPQCPLLDGRTDAVELSRSEAAAADLRACPLCQADATPDSP